MEEYREKSYGCNKAYSPELGIIEIPVYEAGNLSEDAEEQIDALLECFSTGVLASS